VRSLRAARAAAQEPARVEVVRPALRTEAERPRKAGLSQKEQRRLAEVEQAMADLHGRIQELDATLADPATFLRSDSPGHQALKDRETSQAELETLELEWLDLEEKRTLG
jgi:ATP-binding cassette subfamily F protein uup